MKSLLDAIASYEADNVALVGVSATKQNEHDKLAAQVAKVAAADTAFDSLVAARKADLMDIIAAAQAELEGPTAPAPDAPPEA